MPRRGYRFVTTNIPTDYAPAALPLQARAPNHKTNKNSPLKLRQKQPKTGFQSIKKSRLLGRDLKTFHNRLFNSRNYRRCCYYCYCRCYCCCYGCRSAAGGGQNVCNNNPAVPE